MVKVGACGRARTGPQLRNAGRVLRKSSYESDCAQCPQRAQWRSWDGTCLHLPQPPGPWRGSLAWMLGRCSRKIVEPPVCSETAGFTARPNVGCWLARASPETSQIFSLAGTGLTGQGSHSTAGGSNFARAHANRGFQGSTGDPGAQEPPGLHARSLCLGRFSIALLPTPSITTSLDPTLLPSFSFPLPLVRCRFVHCCSIVLEAPWLQLGCWCH